MPRVLSWPVGTVKEMSLPEGSTVGLLAPLLVMGSRSGVDGNNWIWKLETTPFSIWTVFCQGK